MKGELIVSMIFIPRKMYLTTYRIPSLRKDTGAQYTSYLLAHSDEEAHQLIQERRLGEVIDALPTDNLKATYTRPEVLLDRIMHNMDKQKTLEKLLHLVCFLLNLGQVSNRYVVKDNIVLFSDTGLIHQLVHLLTMSVSELNIDLLSTRSLLKELADNTPEMFLTFSEVMHLTETMLLSKPNNNVENAS